MRSIPVDVSAMSFMAAGSPRPKLRSRETGEIKFNADGVQLWQVQVLAAVEGRDGETVLITFPAKHQPTVQLGTALRVQGLVARPWENEGRHGVAFSADAVGPVEQTRKEAA